MSTASGPLKRLPYEPQLFVGREEQIQGVVDSIGRMCRGEVEEKRVRVFTGGTAIGKTWLLGAIRHTVKKSVFYERCLIYEFTLPNRSEVENEDKATLQVHKIMEEFAREILIASIREITLPKLSHRITEGLNQQFQEGKRLVIFLDSVYETAWNFLELFEEYLLGPLANKPEVFTIMSGRGRKFPWATPALRFNSEIVDLQTFSETETVAQIKNQASMAQTSIDDLTKRLHEYSNGVPGINDWLVKDEAFIQGKAPKSLNEMLISLLNSIDADRRSQILDYIEAICVLQVFDDDRIMAMIEAHPKVQHDQKSETIFQKAVQIRRELLQESLATYVDSEGAYKLDESLRRLAVEHLKQSQPDLWRKLQETALNLYEGWAKNYKRTGERWQREVEYHRLELKNA